LYEEIGFQVQQGLRNKTERLPALEMKRISELPVETMKKQRLKVKRMSI